MGADLMEDMAMARGRLRPLLMLSLVMDIAAMADLMDMEVMADPMVDMEVMADLMEDMAMARGRLRPPLMLSLAMAAMADLMVDMEVMADLMEDMVAMDMESKSFLKPLPFPLPCFPDTFISIFIDKRN